MSDTVDLVIVGAGPAGMSAAVAASGAGASVVVLDEQPEPGGQIYRGIASLAKFRPKMLDILGEDYAYGLTLVKTFNTARIDYRPQSQVWQIERDGRVFYRTAAGGAMVTAKKILIATGAMERPLPVPGWTLPGVLTCGAAQILLKANGLAPDGRFVLAGAGPLLLLLAAQLARTGIRPAMVLQTSYNLFPALPHLPGFLMAPKYLAKGMSMLGELKRAGVPIIKGVTGLKVLGTDRVTGIAFEEHGAKREENVDHVLLHQGVVPNANLTWSLRLDHQWDEMQRSWRPVADDWWRSSVENVSVAGDGSGIVGAKGAEYSGAIAGLGAAADLNLITRDEAFARAAPLRAEFRSNQAARPFLDALYKPGREWIVPRDPETIVCRCEEIKAGELRRIVTDQQCPGPNQMKSFVRCGMGPCQGRLCGLTVTELIAEASGRTMEEVGYYRIRPPIKPVTVGDLAALDVPMGRNE